MNANSNTNYEIPVAKNTVDKVMDMLIKENERLEKENQELKEKMGGADRQPGLDNAEALQKAIASYMV